MFWRLASRTASGVRSFAAKISRAARIAIDASIGLLASMHSVRSSNNGMGLSSSRIPASSA